MSGIRAQVTIGSGLIPNSGALLDLKEEGTTTKGLGLPRVKLTDATDITTDISNVTTANADAHIGLVVHATDKFGLNPVNCPGPYVWDGKKWQSLISKETKPDITMTDVDGNVYVARWFTYDPCDQSIGAYWTVRNLYTANKGSGGAFTTGQPRMNPAMGVVTNGFLSIPSTGIPTDITQNYGESSNLTTSTNKPIIKTYQKFAEEYGLLYTHEQAIEACPSGWHLPTDAEWSYLVSGQGGMELCAAKLRKTDRWKWYYTQSQSGTSLTTYQWGENDGDTQPVPSGFDAVPSGVVRADDKTDSFGSWAIYWSAEGLSHDIYYSQPNMENGVSRTGYYLSVRCVKD
jgi:uncharacterized protein (TIGR02145 family)